MRIEAPGCVSVVEMKPEVCFANVSLLPGDTAFTHKEKKNWKVIQVDEQVELEGIRRHRTSVTLANWIGDRTSVLDRGRRSRHINVQRSTPGAYDARYACHRPPACLMACTIPQGRTSSRTSVVNMLQDSECTSISWEFKTGLNQQIPI